MLNIIVELSKYLILIIMLLYTLESFLVFRYEEDYDQRYILRKQLLLIIFLDLTAFLVIFLQTEELKVLYIFGALILYLVIVQALYRALYKTSSILLLNHMCMLLSIGFIMLARLDPDSGLRQMAIAVAATVLAMVIPVMIRKMYFLKKLTWLYAVVGFLMLAVVLVAGSNVNGAKININIGSFAFQPSEFVKIIFVFFVASRLYKKSATFLDHVITTAVAAAYVLVLVLSRDLGSAVVFFITYVVMLYVATKKPLYLFAGLGSGCLAAVIAYFLFSHVRQRVVAWRDPFSVWETSGYQILQGLFAIGAGGWFGVGLCKGSPELIPFVQQDYMFAAICEELGGLFAICMILVCMSMFLLVVNISLRIKKRFYKLIALGLGTEYAFQVFLTIGGVSKFIPMTGITLPLVSYGGSSVLATIIMLAIIQGLYILREDEDEEFERQKKKYEKQLRREEELQKKKRKKAKRRKNREYTIVSYFFVLIFVSLIVYMGYFNIWERDDIISSPYNSRQNQAEDRIVRGSILSADGQTLAYTQTDSEGNETRVYPYGNMFAHVVGYVSNGKNGLEALANSSLMSTHHEYVDRIKNEIMDLKNPGDNVVTTLDARLQEVAYNALGGYNGAVVVMDPQTGAVLASVSKPDFDPNTIEADWDTLANDSTNSSLLNRATQGAYPPGSIFKVVMSLAYLREHGTLDDFSYDCTGSITQEGHTIPCFDGEVHGQVDFTTAFAQSCNTAFVQIGLDLGADTIQKTAEDLLFNKELPISLDYRKSTIDLKKSEGIPFLMQSSIGQGTTLVSPMHMAMITSAVANNGELMKPYYIDHVENDGGDVIKTTKPSVYKELMSESEAQTLKGLMEEVVNSGTGTQLSGESYSAAGKTGSAEYEGSDGSIRTHSWFIGFSNVEDPDLVVAVIAEGAGTGSRAAVPIAHEIFNAYYYG